MRIGDPNNKETRDAKICPICLFYIGRSCVVVQNQSSLHKYAGSALTPLLRDFHQFGIIIG